MIVSCTHTKRFALRESDLLVPTHGRHFLSPYQTRTQKLTLEYKQARARTHAHHPALSHALASFMKTIWAQDFPVVRRLDGKPAPQSQFQHDLVEILSNLTAEHTESLLFDYASPDTWGGTPRSTTWLWRRFVENVDCTTAAAQLVVSIPGVCVGLFCLLTCFCKCVWLVFKCVLFRCSLCSITPFLFACSHLQCTRARMHQHKLPGTWRLITTLTKTKLSRMGLVVP